MVVRVIQLSTSLELRQARLSRVMLCARDSMPGWSGSHEAKLLWHPSCDMVHKVLLQRDVAYVSCPM